MKNLLLLLSISVFFSSAYSQRTHYSLHVGTANYSGELFYKKSKLPEYDLQNAKLAVGLGIEYELLEKVSLRGTFMYGKIGADDKKTGIDPARNLSFATSLWDLTLGAQYYLLNPQRYNLQPYLFTGVSFFHFNPYTYDRAGNKVYLQPLGTEGQGIIPGRDPYKLYQVAIPYGAGIRMQVSDNLRVGLEISARKTFTDYLDDVSTTFVDEEYLFFHRGQQAVDLAFRGNEVNPHADYPAAGTPRGGSDLNDRYYFSTVSFSFRLNQGGGGVAGKRMRCPKFF
ncbi:DUF6089 family protein [Aridibaculum aurantiacum]|uniref:DUF6089 family protein n=1 Tax=Aridibaculum aurantiacum TaxID=2810307 RepID=UPI001A9651C6|nr:DUF6089 family protein [Aridibaculum aurantiacum]